MAEPTSAVTDLATSRELLLLPTDQYVDELSQRYGPFYVSAEIEAGRYEGVDQPVKVVAVPNYLVVNRSMDPELAYRLTKLLFDQKQALAEVHPSARRLELDTASKVAPLELHPGARRYYDEQASTVEVASPSEAVLDYYELDGPRAAGGPGWRLEPSAAPGHGRPSPGRHRRRPPHPGRGRPPRPAVHRGRHPGPPGADRPPLTRISPAPARGR